MEEVNTTPEKQKPKVRLSDVVKNIMKSNAEKKKYDLENDEKVIEAKEKVRAKRKEIKDELQKQHKSVYAEGSKLFENQYKYNVQEKTKLYPLYKTAKEQEEARKADIRKQITFDGEVDENEVQQLYNQIYRDENLKNVANWKSFIGDKLFEAFSKHNLNKKDITQKMIDNIYLNIPKYKADEKIKGNKQQIMAINMLVDDVLNEKIYGKSFREANKIKAVMKGSSARRKVAVMKEIKEAQRNLIEEASSKIGAVMKGNSARKKVALMKDDRKQIDTGTSDFFDDIVGSIVDATKRKIMKLRDTPESKSYTKDHEEYMKSKIKKIVEDAINIQSAFRGAMSRKRVNLAQDIRQADLEKQGELSQITTKAQPGSKNPYIEYKNYKDLDNVQPYLITHKIFKDNIKQNIHGAQSARNLMYYIEQNEDTALRYIKNNKKYIPEYIQNVKTLDQLTKALRENLFIDRSIGVVLKSNKDDKSSKPQTRLQTAKTK